jgi:hypothetical protein
VLGFHRRITAWLLIAPFLAFGWGFATPHMHPGDHESDGHEHVHQHFAPHRLTVLGQDPRLRMAAADDDDDHDVIWLTAAAAHQTIYRVVLAVAVTWLPTDVRPAGQRWYPRLHDDAPPAHGPPREFLWFRGPPALPLCLI